MGDGASFIEKQTVGGIQVGSGSFFSVGVCPGGTGWEGWWQMTAVVNRDHAAG